MHLKIFIKVINWINESPNKSWIFRKSILFTIFAFFSHFTFKMCLPFIGWFFAILWNHKQLQYERIQCCHTPHHIPYTQSDRIKCSRSTQSFDVGSSSVNWQRHLQYDVMWLICERVIFILCFCFRRQSISHPFSV